MVQYSKDSPNRFRRRRRRGIPPAKIRKGGGAAPLKTAKEPGEKHRLEPYFNFGGRKFFNPNHKVENLLIINLLKLMSIIFSAAIMLGTLGIMIGGPLAIFFAFKAHGEQDPVLKKKIKRKALWSILGPILLIFVSITLWGIIQAIKAT